MSQHDLDIANQTASSARADLNLALKALGSVNSGSSAPATTLANMLWYDTTNNTLKMRAEANDAWISLGYLDQSSDAFRIFDNTQVVNSSGSQTGLIGDQSGGTWQTGTGTTESLVSPAKIKAAIVSNTTTYAQPTAAGAVGTYAMLTELGSDLSRRNAGDSVAASSTLYYAGVSITGTTDQLLIGVSPSGTWRLMGNYASFTGNNDNPVSVWLRIS